MMKIGKVGLLVFIVLALSWSSSAWFGGKHKKESQSILAGETTSSWVVNRAGSSILFRVHGNVYPVGFYNVTLNIGQPPRPYFLDVDSGSDLTWLQCDAPCTRCSETPHPLYQPSNDLVPCKDPLCASLQPSEEYECQHPDQCDYEITYADHYSSLGVLVRDVFILNFTNGMQLKVRMALGCGYDQIFPASSYHPLDGVLGIGRGKTSLISQLNGQGLARNLVGHCLSAQGGGYIFFGDVYDSSRLIWTPMTSKDHSKHYSAGAAELIFGGKAMGVADPVTFDSGSSYTYFNSNAYQALISWLKKQLDRKPIKEAPDDLTVPMCWHPKRPFKRISEATKYFKPLALGFTRGGKGEAMFEIPPEAYLIISTKGNVCLGILNGSEVGLGNLNLIGDISMLDKVMVFDNEKQLIGWAPANCDRVPKFRDVTI
ncbi:aspartic proteinase Asp1-like isoform X1 [Prosopis cineraria]|uniref:aspartic proteinase Asp1-like isoform X1 n=1 Tax=Prosopis cineraria TaxID=364024 RepID=UPI00240F02DB|nr:aspartic proteinase Asp1-like isoform X1 [Prosopis cineraria]